MKKLLFYSITFLAYTHIALDAATSNPTHEQFAQGNLPQELVSPFESAAHDLGFDLSAVCLRVPKEEVCQLNPNFNQIAYMPGSNYIFINPVWFASLSPEAQRFAAGANCLAVLQPITVTKLKNIFMAAKVGLFFSVAFGTYTLLGNKDLSPFKDLSSFKKGLLAYLVGCTIRLPIDLLVEKKVIASQLAKKNVDRDMTLISKLNCKAGAIEFYQKSISAFEPYALHNPSIQVTINSLKAGLRIVEGL